MEKNFGNDLKKNFENDKDNKILQKNLENNIENKNLEKNLENNIENKNLEKNLENTSSPLKSDENFLFLYKERLFELFEIYFPITTRKPHPTFLVDFSDLALSLCKILSKKIFFGDFLEKIYEKFSEEDLEELYELKISLRLFYKICLENENFEVFLNFCKNLKIFENKLKFFILESKSKKSENLYIEIYIDFLKFLNLENFENFFFFEKICQEFILDIIFSGIYEKKNKKSFLNLILLEKSILFYNQKLLTFTIKKICERIFFFSEKKNFENFILNIKKIIFRIFFHSKEKNIKIKISEKLILKMKNFLEKSENENFIFFCSFLKRFSKNEINFEKKNYNFYFLKKIEKLPKNFILEKKIEFF